LNFSMKNSYAAHNKALLVYTEYKPVSSRWYIAQIRN
jgi:hypothetical protein